MYLLVREMKHVKLLKLVSCHSHVHVSIALVFTHIQLKGSMYSIVYRVYSSCEGAKHGAPRPRCVHRVVAGDHLLACIATVA